MDEPTIVDLSASDFEAVHIECGWRRRANSRGLAQWYAGEHMLAAHPEETVAGNAEGSR